MKNRIKELRDELGLSIRKLSNNLKEKGLPLSPDSISKYERGERMPKIENWQKLADYFGVTVGYLQGKGVTPDEMLDFIVNMLGITRDIINPVTKEKIDIDSDVLHSEANKWEVRHGGISGRSARQFIDYIKGTEVKYK